MEFLLLLAYWLHLASCSALLCASLYRCWRNGLAAKDHRFLFPFIAVAAVPGAVVSYDYFRILFIVHYSGAMVEASRFPLGTSLEQWLTVLSTSALLPGFALVPWLGRRTVCVAGLAVLALAPHALTLIGGDTG